MFEMWINDLLIEVELEVKPRNRRTYIKPRYPNKVIITSPYSISKDRMIELVKKFESYLYKHLKEKPKAIEKSDSIHVFGNKYKFITRNDIFDHIHVEDDNFICYIRNENTNIKKLVDEYYYKKTKEFVEYYFDTIKKDMNLNFNINIKYKNVKTYFGECIPSKQEIIFSTRLAKYDPIYIKSVIYHELAHFYYHGHGDNFYILMDKKFPNYKRIQHEMRMKRYKDIY